MANTGAPTQLELLTLRFLYETVMGRNPCQPVSWQFIGSVCASLVRRGLVEPDSHYPTSAGSRLAEGLPPVPLGCAHLDGHRCSHDPRR